MKDELGGKDGELCDIDVFSIAATVSTYSYENGKERTPL